MNTKILVRAITAALAVPAIVACGGGGGDPATSSGPTTATRGVTLGPITGFGSVFVNGLKIETEGTQNPTIKIEDSTATPADLKLGMMVKVEWEKDASGRPVATNILYSDDVQGPMQGKVLNTDGLTGSFTVLGQKVIVDRLTIFDNVAGLSALADGNIVEISGPRDANGDVRATRIEHKTTASTEYEFKGVISNKTATTFTIGTVTVNYGSAPIVPPTTWNDGSCVEIKIQGVPTGTTLNATQVKLDDSCSLGAGGTSSSSGEFEIEGYVSGLSGTEFKVNNQAVRVSGSTEYRIENESATSSILVSNVRVEAEGSMGSDGVLVAKKVKLKLGHDDSSSSSSGVSYSEFKGRVTAKGTDTVTITHSSGSSVTVTVNSSTILEDLIKLDLSNLLTTNGVEVYYTMQAGKNVALRIKREDSGL